MTPRVALVTGASRGIGREVARQLSDAGFTVLATSRGGSPRLDVTDQDSVREVAAYVKDTYGRLDVLVNNAGITGIPRGQSKALDELAVDDLRAVLETNLVGVFAVTQAMLPMLRVAGGRVIVVTSTLATFGRVTAEGVRRPDLLPYVTAKAAANMITAVYTAALEGTGVTCHAVSPGYVATDMNDFAGTKTVAEGARVIVHAATAGELPGRALLVEERGGEARPGDPPGARGGTGRVSAPRIGSRQRRITPGQRGDPGAWP